MASFDALLTKEELENLETYSQHPKDGRVFLGSMASRCYCCGRWTLWYTHTYSVCSQDCLDILKENE